jgi:hypothetical protein
MPWFLDQIRRARSLPVPEAWWQGIVNAIAASAMYFKTPSSSFREVSSYSWGFFRNAYAVLPELILHGDSLGATQAVMAMAVFMRQSADTRTTAMLLSIAVQMQHSAGLRIGATTGITPSPAEVENRSRLIWAAFILDMDMSLSTGLPPVHADIVSGLDQPGGDWLQGISLSGLGLPMAAGRRDAVFRLRAELAGIQSRIIPQLTGPKEADIHALKANLEAWRLQIPLNIRPDWHSRTESDGNAESKDVPVAMLHLAYYNSLSMLCWASIRRVKSQMPDTEQVTDFCHDWTSSHKARARAVSRAVIRSLTYFGTRPFGDLW